jgi:hypothetical protein
MTVEYQLLPADLVAFSKENSRFIPQQPSRVYYYCILPGLFAALAVFAHSLGLAAVFAFLYLSTGWLVRHWVERLYDRNTYTTENLRVQTLPRRVTLAEDGIRFSCEAGEVFYRWSFIREVVRGARYVRFVITPLEVMHVPIRAFGSDEHLRHFLSSAQSYVKTEAA